MSKIICDICGTSYPDSADACPICGCSRDEAAALLGPETAEETTKKPVKSSGRFAPAPKAKAPAEDLEDLFDDEDAYEDDDFEEEDEEVEEKPARAVIFGKKRSKKVEEVEEEAYEEEDDFDEEDDEDDDEYDEDDDDDDDEEEGKSNALLVVLLVIVILALIAVSSFIIFRYFIPNYMNKETEPATTAAVVTEAPETTELRIACESLALTSGGEIILGGEGANWLINVMALPENTTDALTYASSDENVVTVNEQGKVTAVGEGTAVITITCGDQQMTCTVTCDFTQETTAPTEPEQTTAPTEPEDATQPEDPTEGEETTAPTEEEKPTEPLKDVKLKVSLTDITFNAPGQGYTFKVNGLKNNEVKWTSMDEKIVTVDENGVVTSVGKGNTTIICQYGDQKVEIKIRCKW